MLRHLKPGLRCLFTWGALPNAVVPVHTSTSHDTAGRRVSVNRPATGVQTAVAEFPDGAFPSGLNRRQV